MKLVSAYLQHGPYTRSGQTLPNIMGLVVHYVGNPGTTARQNIQFFNSKHSRPPYGSYHYLIDLGGAIYRLIPDAECAWHAGPSSKTATRTQELLGGLPNWRTLGISYCHPTADGKPTAATLESLLKLVSSLAIRYSIPTSRILRHHDCTGKICPAYYVRNSRAWSEFLDSVGGRDG
jgi:N-acetylmuramoyl-L-alanine amidase